MAKGERAVKQCEQSRFQFSVAHPILFGSVDVPSKTMPGFWHRN